MDEFDLINTYFARAPLGTDVLLGIGDDCAIVQPPEGRQLVMSIDTMVDGVHFPHGTAPERIGVRAMCAALSDLAAMGARAHWFTMALTLPESDPEWVSAFAEGVFSVANRYECSLIGGDTTKGPLCVTVQVHGSVEPGKALRRSGARPDDVIYVTGNLGDGAAALAVIQKQLTVSAGTYSYLLKRFYAPTPRIPEGEMLVGMASAAIDVSDGLYADLGKICEASGVGAVVEVTSLPISEHWRSYTTEGQSQQWALTGGDDYQLCFTVPSEHAPRLDSWIAEGRINATAIGRITHKQELLLVKNGKPFELERRGYDHFG
ncbi:thiamine-phosphate kinase [Saccharophagus sp. K07]|uniref:thiamine-phosphate kinase n=1 Tax=Saccharophagus sp. K07 TaxID=2283636 RepID=UPI0016527A13|nr:thiamine-phosphate kinase [Saccharophagus sp. K07]MBC6904028.1 thiamine-phosphate kinase [Saccharophagus sp. K07]